MCSCLTCLSSKATGEQVLAQEMEKDKTLDTEGEERAQNDADRNGRSNNVDKIVAAMYPADLVLGTSDTEADTMHDSNSESDSADMRADNPFDPKYELWEVVGERTKARIREHKKSRKICWLTRGNMVRCVKRSPGDLKFKIDLPVVGWLNFDNAEKMFQRVDPSSLPVLDSRFVLELKVGQGSFGKVFVAWDNVRKRKVALKLDQPKSGKRSVFHDEVAIMKVVTECPSVPSLLSSGCVSSHTVLGKEVHKGASHIGLQYMTQDLQGMSLSMLKKNYLTLFSLKTVLMLGIVMVKILRQVHETGILHRDIKPANFVVSRGDRGRNIYILDFGLSTQWRNLDGSHVGYKENCRRCGTARYSSINTHKRYRQSRRDDLEALGYVLLLFLRDLPWKQQKGEPAEKKWKRILVEKMWWTPVELCSELSSSVKKLFCNYFQHCRKLDYNAEPNYNYLVRLFAKTLEDKKEQVDFIYDWMKFL